MGGVVVAARNLPWAHAEQNALPYIGKNEVDPDRR